MLQTATRHARVLVSVPEKLYTTYVGGENFLICIWLRWSWPTSTTSKNLGPLHSSFGPEYCATIPTRHCGFLGVQLPNSVQTPSQCVHLLPAMRLSMELLLSSRLLVLNIWRRMQSVVRGSKITRLVCAAFWTCLCMIGSWAGMFDQVVPLLSLTKCYQSCLVTVHCEQGLVQ